MSERYTEIRPKHRKILVAGVVVNGRVSRKDMISEFRKHYRRSLREAARALELSDDDLIVKTYLGVHAIRDVEVVE